MNTLTAAQEVLETGTWKLDAVHSRVGFAVDYLAGTFHGAFAPFDATLAVEENGAATLTGNARVESIQVADENLGAHLLSPEFFDAEQAPEITFVSNPFKPAGQDIAVDGTLTIKGASLRYSWPARSAVLSSIPTVASASTSGSKQESTGRPSGSTGTPRFRAASRHWPRTSRSPPSWRSSRSNNADPRHLRQPQTRVLQHEVAARCG